MEIWTFLVLDFETFVSVFKYLLQFIQFFFPALQFFLMFGITKEKKNCYSFVFFRFCNTFVTVFRFRSVL